MADIQYYGTGRRKTSTARVYLRPGTGEIKVNRKTFDEYFPNQALRMVIRQPLTLTDTANKFDILVNVAGGGPAGQAGAVRHGITRALMEFNADLRPALKDAGLVTRAADPTDRRCSLVTVSPAGSELLAVLRTRKDAYLAQRLEALSSEDREALDRAAAILERMLKEGGE